MGNGSIPTRASKFPQIPCTNRGTVSMRQQGIAFVTYVFEMNGFEVN